MMASALRHPRLASMRLRVRCTWALALLAMLVVPSMAGAASSVGAVGPNVLVRPADSPTVTAGASLLAAGNEFESFQVVMRAAGAPLTSVDVQIVGALAGPGGVTIPSSAFTVYRVGYYDVTGLPSDGDLGGALGRFPDILIPSRDTLWGEPRSAFPIDVPAGENRLAWIDLLVPPSVPTGTYFGARIRVTAGGQLVREVPITLTVGDLTLPSTTSLDGGFDINSNRICQAHACGSQPGGQAGMVALYERAALDNRLTLAKPPNATPSGPDDASYRTYTRPLLTGTGTGTRLKGATLRTVTIFQWAVESADEWRRTADADGYTKRVRFHCDEILKSATLWNACRTDWTRANALWRGAAAGGTVTDLPLQVTASIDDVNWARANGYAAFVDRISILVPVINYVHPKTVPAFPGRRADYAAWSNGTTPGGVPRALWAYTSCMSMGCSPNIADDHPAWSGWPSYGVDQPASEARAMGWTAFEYDLDGEYYYETARDLPTSWTSLWSPDGGNHGDGTLFYPGTVARIGGTHDIPLESIRLKRIRDGREDYEWLLAASRAAGRPAALGVARGLVSTAFATDVSQARIDAARVDLAALVAGRGLRGALEDGGGAGAGTGGGGGGSTTKPPKPGQPVPRIMCGGRRATIVGTARGDVLRGTAKADVIAGLGGNDRIVGLGGADIICGGTGNDAIVTSGDRARRDIIVCGAGRDAVSYDRADRVLPGCERRLRRR